jgi:glycerate 2-kinase
MGAQVTPLAGTWRRAHLRWEWARHFDDARLVITGEGSLDAQSLHGKAPVGVARAAAGHDPAVPVVAVAGVCTLSAAELREAGISAAYALSDIEPDLSQSIANAGPLVERLAERIADDWLR